MIFLSLMMKEPSLFKFSHRDQNFNGKWSHPNTFPMNSLIISNFTILVEFVSGSLRTINPLGT